MRKSLFHERTLCRTQRFATGLNHLRRLRNLRAIPHSLKNDPFGTIFNAAASAVPARRISRQADMGSESSAKDEHLDILASPETMLSSGVSTDVAHDIASNLGDPAAMAKAVTDTTMDKTYGPRNGGFAPAAAFDVIDLDPKKAEAVASAIKALDATLSSAAADRSQRSAIRENARASTAWSAFPKATRCRGARTGRRSHSMKHSPRTAGYRRRFAPPRFMRRRNCGYDSRTSREQRLRTVQQRGLLECLRRDRALPGRAQSGRYVGDERH